MRSSSPTSVVFLRSSPLALDFTSFSQRQAALRFSKPEIHKTSFHLPAAQRVALAPPLISPLC